MKTGINPFRAAIQYLRKPNSLELWQHEFICNAILKVRRLGEADYSDCNVAINMIGHRMGGMGTLGDWLRARGISSDDTTANNMQTHRHQWILMLAEDWDKGIRK